MEQGLRNTFEALKFCTLECINSVQNDEYDALDKLILKRQEILDSISNMNNSKVDYNSLVNDLDILSMEKRLSSLIQEKKIELKDKINKIGKNKKLANSYNKGALKKAVFFSKKI